MARAKTQDDVKDPDALVAAQERADNEYLKSLPGKAMSRVGSAIRQGIMGSDAQNKAAADQMRQQDAQDPDSTQARINRATNYGGYKKGGLMEHKHAMEHHKEHAKGTDHKHHSEHYKEHAAGHKLHHDHVKAMCMGGKTK